MVKYDIRIRKDAKLTVNETGDIVLQGVLATVTKVTPRDGSAGASRFFSCSDDVEFV